MSINETKDAKLTKVLGWLREQQADLAQAELKAKQEVTAANLRLEDASQGVKNNKETLQWLEEVYILLNHPIPSEVADLRSKMALWYDEAIDLAISEDRAKELQSLMEAGPLELQRQCKHPLVFGAEGTDSPMPGWSTTGHMICAHCGLSEKEGAGYYRHLGPAEGRQVLIKKDIKMDRLAFLGKIGSIETMLEEAFSLKRASELIDVCTKSDSLPKVTK